MIIPSSSKIKSIQRGTISMTGSATSGTATITSVDTTKSELRFMGSSNTDTITDTTAISRVVLTNATTVTANRSGTSPTGTTVVGFEVTEWY